MRIHVWSPRFAGFGGGIAAAGREAVRALLANGHELELFGKADTKGAVCGARVSGVGTLPPDLQSVAFAAVVATQALRKQPDKILSLHVNHGPVAQILRRAAGIEYVLIAHGIEIDSTLRPSRIRALQCASTIIAVSEWTKARLIKYGNVDSDRVTIIPNTFDHERFSVAARPEGLRGKYGLGPAEPVILTVTRLSMQDSYKGVDRLIEALPAVRNVVTNARLLVVGEGDDASRLKVLAQTFGVAEAVTFGGFVSDDELPDHYRLADVFAMPSTGEGFGIVFLEAMGCGTPVLGGNRDGSVDALARGSLGLLVDPFLQSEVASGLISLLQRHGNPTWFDRRKLHEAVTRVFGRDVYSRRFARVISAPA